MTGDTDDSGKDLIEKIRRILESGVMPNHPSKQRFLDEAREMGKRWARGEPVDTGAEEKSAGGEVPGTPGSEQSTSRSAEELRGAPADDLGADDKPEATPEVAVIDNVKHLPSWFNLRRYDSAKDLSLQGWRFEFDRRIRAFLIDEFVDDWATFAGVRFQDSSEEPPAPDPGNPVCTMTAYVGLLLALQLIQKFITHPVWVEHFVREDHPHDMVSLSDLRDCIEAGRSDFLKVPLNEFLGAIPQVPEIDDPITGKKLKIELPTPKLVPVLVDTTPPNDLLIERFKDWLSDERPAFRDVDPRSLRRLHQRRLLPYLDLFFWARLEKDAIITDRCMAKALFPDAARAGNELQELRQTRDRAEEVFDLWGIRLFSDYYAKMADQLRRQQTEKNQQQKKS